MRHLRLLEYLSQIFPIAFILSRAFRIPVPSESHAEKNRAEVCKTVQKVGTTRVYGACKTVQRPCKTVQNLKIGRVHRNGRRPQAGAKRGAVEHKKMASFTFIYLHLPSWQHGSAGAVGPAAKRASFPVGRLFSIITSWLMTSTVNRFTKKIGLI